VIAALALAVGGGGAYVYMRLSRPAGTAAPVGTVAEAKVIATEPADAARSGAPLGDAPPAPSVPTAPPVIDAAVPPAPAATEAIQPDKKPPRSPPAVQKPNGPPGFITIDSAPVYAVIYIDGKRYGETPLVKLALSPGRHTVHAVAPSGASRDLRITIEAGKVAPASRIEW
jgi:serine/threonine-protein kinase